MNNSFFSSVIKIRVKGKNINNFIKKIIDMKINVFSLEYISYNEIDIIVSYFDYFKLKKKKTIYNITIIKKYGFVKLKEIIKNNYILLLFLLLGVFFTIFLSNIIFNIEVIHSNSDIRSFMIQELDNYGIKKHSFKKSYKSLERIKNEILLHNKDKLEWIEIISSGTKYIVRVEERKINSNTNKNIINNITVNKNAVITRIDAYSGEKVKNINDYVKKGDIIISSNIILPDGSITLINASGKVFGKVWYKVKIDYPYIYKEENYTGKEKNVLVLNILNKRISIFDFKKYKTFKYTSNYLFNSFFNFVSLVKEKQYEIKIIDNIYTKEEAINLGIDLAKEKLLSGNDRIVKIISTNILKKEYGLTKINLELFIEVEEEIAEITENAS